MDVSYVTEPVICRRSASRKQIAPQELGRHILNAWCIHCVQSAVMSDPVTLRLDPKTRKRLDKLARATERSRAALAADAVRQYLDLNEWQIAAIQAGAEEANRGRLIDHAELKAKWEKKLAAAVDASR
jgi:RHH-type transcriptional regulator, rel operon repressor / antitoxin RelB